MRERELAAVCGLEGAFNRISIDLAPGSNAERVMAEVDRALLPYGGLTAYGRRNHSSDKALNGEIQILKALSIAFPVVFLGISTLMITGLLARAVHVQREQIAQLKALGYSALQLGAHYLKFALVIVASGLLIGVVSGVWLGSDVVLLYHKFFRFPSLPFAVDYTAIGTAVAIGLCLDAFGGKRCGLSNDAIASGCGHAAAAAGQLCSIPPRSSWRLQAHEPFGTDGDPKPRAATLARVGHHVGLGDGRRHPDRANSLARWH